MHLKRIKILLIIAILLTVYSTSITMQPLTDLPQLKNDTYTYYALDPVNVTIGQQFTIGIFQLDVLKVPEDIKVYEISQEKFINMFQTLQKKHNLNQQKFKRQEIDKNIFSCTIKSPTMEIIRTLSVNKQNPSNKFNMNSEQRIIYVPVGSRQLLYLMDTTTMELQVYHFTPQKLIFLSSVKINGENNQKSISMASGSNQQFLYIFSDQGMWSIKTSTVLTNVQRLSNGLNSFNTLNYPIDKLYHGAYNFLFALKRSTAVYLISQQPNQQVKFITITKYQDIPLIPQDLYVEGSKLYILDLQKGIFIFHILGDGKVIQYDYIIWNSFGNLQLYVKQSSIFIRYIDQGGQKIVQLNYNSQIHRVSLVRYYKSDQMVTNMVVQLVPVFVSHLSYSINQPFVFFTADNGQIQIFPYNIDPRMINSAHNSIKMNVQNIVKLIYLYQDLYLIITADSLLYTKIRIQKPELKCQIKQSTGHVYYQLQFSSNISSCQTFDNTISHKNNYNNNCKLISNYIIFIDDPDLSRLQKALLYGVVFLVVALFVTGLLCLIQWRNNKLSLIGRIKDQIVKLRDRYRKMQPFTQQQQQNPKNSVEFELPEVPPLPSEPIG